MSDLTELFQYGIDGCIMEFHQACADCEIGLISALEVYETGCLIGAYDTITEGASTDNLQAVYEGSMSDFFKKIADLFKAAVEKIRKIGKKIIEKITTMWNHIKEKVKGFKIGHILEKKWSNGFDFDLPKGAANLEDFAKVNHDLNSTLIKDFKEYTRMVVTKSSDDKIGDWMKKHPQYVTDGLDPRTWYNDKLKVKFNDEDNAIKNWIEDIFGYKQYGPDYRIGISKGTTMARDILNCSTYFNMIDLAKGSVLEADKKLSDAGSTIESMGKKMTGQTKYAAPLRYLGSTLIRFAEFGVITTSQASNFGLSKLNEMVDAFCNMKFLYRTKTA